MALFIYSEPIEPNGNPEALIIAPFTDNTHAKMSIGIGKIKRGALREFKKVSLMHP